MASKKSGIPPIDMGEHHVVPVADAIAAGNPLGGPGLGETARLGHARKLAESTTGGNDQFASRCSPSAKFALPGPPSGGRSPAFDRGAPYCRG